MKKNLRMIATLLCTLLMGLFAGPLTAQGADTATVEVDMDYGQTEARGLLSQLNELRTGSDAWAWDASNSKKDYYSDLQELRYDYRVEEIAMQRAAELALLFGNNRPNGGRNYEMDESYDGVSLRAVSIYVGDSSLTPEKVIAAWIGDEASYDSQGTRRIILNSEINAVGIGHVYYNGNHYWVLELASVKTDDMAKTAANDSTKRVSIDILPDLVSITAMECSKKSISLNAGKSAKLPEVAITAEIAGHWPTTGLCPIVSYTSAGADSLKWKSANSKVAKVTTNGKVKAVAAGTTTLTASCGGFTVTCKVTVKAATPTLNASSKTLNVEDTYTLKLSGATAASFSSNKKSIATVSSKGKITAKKAGTATITVKDTDGNTYKCKVTVTDHTHSWGKGVITTKATCEEAGIRTYTCAGCGKTKTTSIAAKGHNYVSKVIEPEGAKQGYTEHTCSVCGDSYKDTYTNGEQIAEDEVYAAMIALKEKYPEGKRWTNDDYYEWNGGYYSGGYGCAAFAFILSDAAFGELPVRMHEDFSDIKVGDIIRMNYDTHSVIVLEVKSDSVIIAEGNYNYSIHWGREISLSEIRKTGTYVMTRYPE